MLNRELEFNNAKSTVKPVSQDHKDYACHHILKPQRPCTPSLQVQAYRGFGFGQLGPGRAEGPDHIGATWARTQGSFPKGTRGNGVPTPPEGVGTAFPHLQRKVKKSCQSR